MNKPLLFSLALFCVFPLVSSLATASTWPQGAITGLQHAGAIYFDLEPGTFEITVYRRDLPAKNAVDRTLKILLFAPDGTKIDENILLSKREIINQPGERVQMDLRANIRRAGVYMLLLSSPNREGDSYEWGFSTNAPKYVISSVAGHPRRDPDPIILRAESENSADKPFSIFFKTPPKSFKIIASHLPKSAKSLQLYDAEGKLVSAFDVINGKAEAKFNVSQQEVWELRLPSKQGRYIIDGMNRNWQASNNAFPVWTTSREHYFDISNYYWLLQPRRFSRAVLENMQGNIAVNIANSSAHPMSLSLKLDEVPPFINARVIPEKVLLQPGTEQEVQIQYDVFGSASKGNSEFYLLAQDENTGKQSFSRFELRADHRTLGKNVTLPIDVQLYASQSQFAYEPDYPRTSQIYFDNNNNPWVIDTDGLKVLLNGRWEKVVLPGGNKTTDVYPASIRSNVPEKTIGTDSQGFVYAVVMRDEHPYLLRVSSRNLNAQVAPLPDGGDYMLEVYNGGGFSDYPPVVLRYTETKADQIARWAKLHSIEMFIPAVNNEQLTISDPILISDNCIGMAAHSGMPSPAASFGENIYLIWGATSDPAKNDPGVPTYVATYNRKTKTLSKSLLAYSPPVNDVHNMSSILVDSKGGKHALIGSHGKPFQYLYSAGNSDHWTSPKKLSKEEQTYVGATFNRQGGITLFFRVWDRQDVPGNAIFAYQQMDPEGNWSEIQHFAKGPLLSYGVYYHRVTVDRTGRVYVSFEYWTTWDNYRNSIREPSLRYRLVNGLDRWVFSSKDGTHWDLLRTTRELAENSAASQ